MLIVDAQAPDLPVVLANPAFSAITGYQHEEILGRNCRFMQGTRTDQDTVAQIRASLQQRRPFRGEPNSSWATPPPR